IYACCLPRLLEVELGRGETPTPSTDAALSLRSLAGAETFVRILRALHGERFARGYGYGQRGQAYTLRRLLQVTLPGAADRPGAFCELAATSGITPPRFVEAVVYAPQWARHIERLVGWEGLADAIWWIHAHTKDRNWSVEEAIRAEWEAQVSTRTPLSS